jgi:NADH-quinone oxidoreductase subunit C
VESAEIHAVLKEEFGDAVVEENLEAKDPYLVVRGEGIAEICLFARDDPRLKFDLLSCLSSVDWKEHFSVVYHLESTEHHHWLVLRADLPRDAASVPTVSHVWGGADWHEREAFDLMGIRFEGHPNLVRILCAEDWVGHPLRKDYEFPREYHGVPCEFDWEDSPWSDK